jgi:hypothetical protein
MSDKRSEFPDGEDREKIEREMAEREAVIKRAEVLAWAYERQAARGVTNVTPEKRFPSARRALRETDSQPAAMSREWTDYIQRQIARHERAMARAVGQVMVDEERAREKVEQRCAALESELAELRDRLDQGKRLKAVT